MREFIHEVAQFAAQIIEAAGILVIISGFILSILLAIVSDAPALRWGQIYEKTRQHIGRTLLLGLEFLVAAEIVRSIMVTDTIRGVTILAIVVAVRTFLSIALDMEINGRWPWQARAARHAPDTETKLMAIKEQNE